MQMCGIIRGGLTLGGEGFSGRPKSTLGGGVTLGGGGISGRPESTLGGGLIIPHPNKK